MDITITRHIDARIEDVQRAVCARYGATLEELRGASRMQSTRTIRCVAVYLAREVTGASYHELARMFARGDHSTMISACRRAKRLIETDPLVAEAADELLRKLTGQPAKVTSDLRFRVAG